MPMEETVYHDEFGSGVARGGLVVTGASLLFAASEAIRGFPNEALGLLVGVLGTIVGLTIWSVNRHSGVRVTSGYLQVGREKLSRDDLDRSFGAHDATALTAEERTAIESPFPISKSAGVRVPGGAFARIKGTSIVVLRSADGTSKLAFSSRRADDLIDLLRGWLLESS